MLVEEIMNRTPATIKPGANLAEALQTMADKKSRHLVVVDGDGDVTGIISDRDLAMYYDPAGMSPEKWAQAEVEEIMSHDPDTIGSQADVAEAAKLLLRLNVSALPVVDNGALTGILSEKEFVRYFANMKS